MEEIEQRVEAILARVPEWIWDGERLPVPVEDIVDSCYGLHVREVEDLARVDGAPALGEGQSLSGLLLEGPGEIWVDRAEAEQWPTRRRFTISHELGHWELHRSGLGGSAIFCRNGTVEPPDDDPAPERPPLPPTEEEANVFAAALLMPARLVREHYPELKGDFFGLCERFAVSGAAMGRRLHRVIS